MATESVTNDAGHAGMDRFDVETELMKAAALADILACAGTGEITPRDDTITIVADLLGKAIENVRVEIFDKPAALAKQEAKA